MPYVGCPFGAGSYLRADIRTVCAMGPFGLPDLEGFFLRAHKGAVSSSFLVVCTQEEPTRVGRPKGPITATGLIPA